MMNRHLVVVMISFCILFLSATDVAGQTYRVLTEEFPPYNYTKNGEINGISTEIVREILKRVKHRDNIELLPWSEGYNLIQRNDNVVLYSTTRSHIREKLFKWVGPLVPDNLVFFARKGSGISIKSLEDAKRVKSIGAYMNDFGELFLREKKFTNLNTAMENRVNVGKLASGEIDLWITGELNGKYLANEAGLAGRIEKVFDVQRENMYIAFSKSTPDTEIKKWQKALDDMKSDGTYAQAFRRALLAAANAAKVHTFRIMTEEFPPYNYTENGTVKGISADIVREILKKVGHPDNIEVLPWTDGYNLIQQNDNHILFSTTRSPMRENLFKWVGPLVPNNTVFFARKGSGLSIKSLEDAKRVKSIGAYRDDFGELLLKEKRFTNISSVISNGENAKRLVSGEIELWIANELTGKHLARQAGLADKIEKVFDVQQDNMYIAFSKNTPDAVIGRWQKALDEMKSDGTYAQVFSAWVMFSYTGEGSEKKVEFTEKEKAWISDHPVIRVAPDPDYAPFQFRNEDGESRGLADDYLELIGEKLGIRFEPVPTESWKDALNLVKERHADMVVVAAKTPEREKYMSFTSPYVEFPEYIITRKGRSAIASLDQLQGKTVATVKSFAINEYVKQKFPNIRLLMKPDVEAVLKSVSMGEADATLLNMATISYAIEKTRIVNLKVGGETGFSYKLAFASRSDWPILNNILEKGLSTLSTGERREITRKWITVSYEKKPEKENSGRVEFTEAERAWIEEHPIIMAAPDPDWAPVEFFNEDGLYVGISADFAAMLTKITGIHFSIVHLDNFRETLEHAKKHEVDMLLAVAKTPKRNKHLLFTKPYLNFKTVIIVSSKVEGSLAMEDLKGKTVAVVSGFALQEYLEKEYPEIGLDLVADTVEGLERVSFGKSDALISNIAVASYFINKEVIPDLRIAGDAGYVYDLGIGTRKDWPMLNSIMNKALAAITEEEKRNILNKWVSLQRRKWRPSRELLLGLAVTLIASFIIGIIAWNRQLRGKVELRTKELQASEEKFRNIFENIQDIVYRIDQEGKFIWVSASVTSLGYDPEELVGSSSLGMFTDLRGRENLVKALKAGGGFVSNYEMQTKRKDGTKVWISLNAHFYSDSHGNVIGTEGTLRDITRRKQADEELRKARKKAEEAEMTLAKTLTEMQTIMNAMPDLLYVYNTEGKLIKWNKSMEEFTGLTPEELMFRSGLEFACEEDRPLVAEKMQEVFVKGQSSLEARLLNKDGVPIPFFLNGVALKNEKGEVIGFTGTGRDMTELKKAEDKLKETLAQMEIILENAGVGIDHGTSKKFTWMNKAMREMLGYSKREIAGLNIVSVFAPDDEVSEEAQKEFNSRIDSGEAAAFEIHTKRKDGSNFWGRRVVRAVDPSDFSKGFIGITEDFSERRRMEEELRKAMDEAERANKAKSQFLSSMSHELRTPLNSILGFGQLMESDQKEPLSKSQMENIGQVIKSGNHLLNLIDEVLDLAKIEAGRFNISLEAVNTVEVVEEALVLIGTVARHRKLSLKKDIAEGDWFVKADLTRLKQVVLNLLSNAVKYNREGGTVTVAVYPGQDGGTTCIAVEDTGMGISEENIPKLFEPFNRLGAETMNVEGTGIGLTITKCLVELMGGDIRVESGVGKGSRFIVTLPAAIEPAQDIHELESIKPLAVESPAGQMTLLYVEDNPANLKLVERIIERRPNLKMISAPYAQLGIDLARAHNPFVVLMDINLPGMNGFEALKELRQNDDTADIPVIAVSANAMPKDIQRAKEAGFEDYITKPINIGNFLKVIDKAMSKKR